MMIRWLVTIAITTNYFKMHIIFILIILQFIADYYYSCSCCVCCFCSFLVNVKHKFTFDTHLEFWPLLLLGNSWLILRQNQQLTRFWPHLQNTWSRVSVNSNQSTTTQTPIITNTITAKQHTDNN